MLHTRDSILSKSRWASSSVFCKKSFVYWYASAPFHLCSCHIWHSNNPSYTFM